MKIFAKKIGTTHYYTDTNKHQIVTILELKKSKVAKIKSEKTDGYKSIVYIEQDPKFTPRKSIAGQFKDVENARYIFEEAVEGDEFPEIATEYTIKDIQVGDKLEISGTTKGKGFQGTVKRHSFNTGPKTHGSNNYRQPGSIGATYPERTLKGKKMAGHMGSVNQTQKSVTVERVDEETNTIWVKGHVMGPNKSRILIKK